MNACLAVWSGRSRDPYMQTCVRELFAADPLSRAHTGRVYRDGIAADESLGRAGRHPCGTIFANKRHVVCVFSFSDRRQLEQGARAWIGKAFRPGTQANHCSHVLLYSAFTAHFREPDFPATPHSLVLFREFLLCPFRAPKSVTNALAFVSVFHLDAGLASGAFVSRKLELFRRSLYLTLRHVPAQAALMPFEVLVLLCRGARGLGDAGLAFTAKLSSLVPPSRR